MLHFTLGSCFNIDTDTSYHLHRLQNTDRREDATWQRHAERKFPKATKKTEKLSSIYFKMHTFVKGALIIHKHVCLTTATSIFDNMRNNNFKYNSQLISCVNDVANDAATCPNLNSELCIITSTNRKNIFWLKCVCVFVQDTSKKGTYVSEFWSLVSFVICDWYVYALILETYSIYYQQQHRHHHDHFLFFFVSFNIHWYLFVYKTGV